MGLASLLVTLQFELVEYLNAKPFYQSHMKITEKSVLFSHFFQWADDSEPLHIIVVSYLIILVTSFVFIICEPGQYFTKQFEKFSDVLGQCDWYLLSIEMQRM